MSLEALGRDLLVSCLVTGGLRAADLARLRCAARGFSDACQDAAQRVCTASPFVTVTKRRDAEDWLQLLARLERGLCFTAANEDLVKLDGAGTATHTGQHEAAAAASAETSVAGRLSAPGSGPSIPPHEASLWATAVCADAVMSSGIHRCTFSIQTKRQTTIGIVPAAWATLRPSHGQSIQPAAAGGWASDQECSYLLTCDGRLWHGEHLNWFSWGVDGTQEKFAGAGTVELELDLVEGKLTARVDTGGDDGVWQDCMAYGLKPHSDRLGGFCWCAELAGEGDCVHVAWSE